MNFGAENAFMREAVPARNTDPGTSKATRPKAPTLREQVLNCIKFSHGTGMVGSTGHEAARTLGGIHRLNSVTPRFAELRKAGRIKDSGQRRDGQIVWVLA